MAEEEGNSSGPGMEQHENTADAREERAARKAQKKEEKLKRSQRALDPDHVKSKESMIVRTREVQEEKERKERVEAQELERIRRKIKEHMFRYGIMEEVDTDGEEL